MTYKKIPLSQGKFALVDVEDYQELSQYKWHYCNGYAARNTGHGKTRVLYYMHREILNPEPGLYADHINRNRLDNRRANLRAVPPSENSKNRPQVDKTRCPIKYQKAMDRVRVLKANKTAIKNLLISLPDQEFDAFGLLLDSL